jgi:hypothetical protein
MEYEAKRRVEDKKLILDEGNWPRWPYMPMKRWNEERRTMTIGVIAAGNNTTVHDANVWGGKIKGKHEYETLDELLEDGWKVD